MMTLLYTGGTMLLSLLVYAWAYGWRYAVGFIGLLFVHEMGHYIAARQRHLKVGAPTFIPFVGAWIEMKQLPHDAETEAYVGMGGPLLGTLGALACYHLALNEQSGWLLAVAYSGFFLNLFNLIPLSPLDGGRITQVISPRLWLVGAPLLVAAFFWLRSPLLIMIAVLAGMQLLQDRQGGDAPEAQAYHRTAGATRLAYAVAYLGLVGFLAVMTHHVHRLLSGGRWV